MFPIGCLFALPRDLQPQLMTWGVQIGVQIARPHFIGLNVHWLAENRTNAYRVALAGEKIFLLKLDTLRLYVVLTQ